MKDGKDHMKTKEYLQLLEDGKEQQAEELRISTVPDKLIKFVSLNGDDSDSKKLKSLENNEIWFSDRRFLNDPYEFKGIVLDKARLSDNGYAESQIEILKKILECDEWGITCLSANSVDYLPMWAYYTNNYAGFCVEYSIENKSQIHEVFYEQDRIKISYSAVQYMNEVEKSLKFGTSSPELDFLGHIFLQNLFIKAKKWNHEKEYRIVCQLDNRVGMGVPVDSIGMKMKKIIAGMNCSTENVEKLNEISNKLGLKDVYKSRLHEDEYRLEIYR